MISRRLLSIFVTVCVLIVMPGFAAERAEQAASLRIACVGDSITFGAGIKGRAANSYPAQLEKRLGKHAVVGNFGVSGATLLKKGDKPYWEEARYQDALDFEPDLVIIKLGTNDSKPKNWQYKSEYIADYRELIETFKNLDSQPTVWIGYPVPVYSSRWGITDVVIKEAVIPLIDAIAEQADVKIIDLYAALSDKAEMFPDTVHPNAAGARVMAETIAVAVAEDF